MTWGVIASAPCAKCGRPFLTAWPPVPGRMCVKCTSSEMNVEAVDKERFRESRRIAKERRRMDADREQTTTWDEWVAVAKRQKEERERRPVPVVPIKPSGPISAWRNRKIGFVAIHGGVCCFCRCAVEITDHVSGQRVPDNAATYEHVIPRSAGGSNALKNLRLSCYQCNTHRGSMDFDLFMALTRDERNRPKRSEEDVRREAQESGRRRVSQQAPAQRMSEPGEDD